MHALVSPLAVLAGKAVLTLTLYSATLPAGSLPVQWARNHTASQENRPSAPLPADDRDQTSSPAKLLLRLTPELCANPASVRPQLSRRSPQPEMAVAVPAWQDCGATVRASPGRYVLSWTGRTAIQTTEFNLQGGEQRTIELTPVPRVQGRLKTAIPGVDTWHLRVTRPAVTGLQPLGDVPVAPDGEFLTEVSEAGDYVFQLWCKSLAIPGQELHAEIRGGVKVVEWEVRGGVVQIEITEWKVRRPLHLRLTLAEPTEPGTISHGLRLDSPDQLPVTIPGLKFAKYEIQAKETAGPEGAPPAATSDRVEVNLSQDAPWTSIQLTVTDRKRFLGVREHGGDIVADATMVSDDGAVRRMPDGRFDLAGIGAGEHLLVKAAGFVPRCYVVSDAEDEVLLERGRPATLVFRSRVDAREPPGRLVWPGTDCPVATRAFAFEPVEAKQASSREFLLPSFPTVGPVGFLYSPFDTASMARPIDESDSRIVIDLR
jgi:hypothetical protein